MKMYLELDSKEITKAIGCFVKMRYGETVYDIHIPNFTIDARDLDKHYHKNIQAILVPSKDIKIKYCTKEPLGTLSLSTVDFKECLNDCFLKERNLRISGDISFFLKLENEEAIKNVEKGVGCLAGMIEGKVMTGFQVENRTVELCFK